MYWVNGILKDKLLPTDRSVNFGDGIFTTARVVNKKIELFNFHIDRLKESSERLFFSCLEETILLKEIKKAIKNFNYGIIKILISRGNSKRGYSIDNCGTPNRIIFLSDIPYHYSIWEKRGINLMHVPIRVSRNKILSGIKHCNRLEQVLIRSYLDRNNAEEALVLDTEGIIVGCCSSNIFWRYGNSVFTPKIYYSGILGVMRKKIMLLLPKLGFNVFEIFAIPEELICSDEVFITNSIIRVIHVRKIGKRSFKNKFLYLKLIYYIRNHPF